jgi:aldehyde:ferredoxin oxidoreductase
VGFGLPYATSHNGARMGSGIEAMLGESITGCGFAVPPFAQIWGSMEEAVKVFLEAACGWSLTVDDIKTISRRNYYFNRCISLREGYLPSKDDILPPRAFDEPIADKYGTSWVWGREEFESAKKDFYRDKLGLTPEGLPGREQLEQLELDFVIPVLKPMGLM